MKSNFKKILFLILTSFLFIVLNGCHKGTGADELKVGTIAGPETDLMVIAKEVARKKYGLAIKIIPFTDYTMPNRALADGSIDANIFQTLPYLQADMTARGFKLSRIGKTFIYPMAIYSKKITAITETPIGAIIAVPNDPSNEARALILLEKAGLITLKSKASVFATTLDIVKNPKKLKIKELDAAQLARVLPDVTFSVINTNYAVPAGLYPSRDAIYMEDKDSPYANIIVVRTADKNNPKFITKMNKLIAALHSPKVLVAANKLFKGQAVAAW